MKIAMLIGSLQKGGAERVLVNLADYLTTKGHRVLLVTTYQREDEYVPNPQVKRIISEISEEEITGNRISNFHRRFKKLRNIWKQEKPTVVLSFIGKNNFMNILTTAFLPVATAVAVRGAPEAEYYSKWMRIMARGLFRFADGVILQTNASKSFFGKSVRKKAVILRNPISESFFRPRFQGERENTIVAVGRLDENKNHAMLIHAFDQIADTYPEYKLVIYGEGEDRDKITQLIQQLGRSDRIVLPGNSDNIADVIYRAKVFVLPSNTEGLPNTLIEAMILGLTVIATNCPCGGPADLIDHGVNGLLTPVRDTNKMKENLQIILNDLQLSDRLGENATKTSVIFRPEIVNAEWEKYLISLHK